MITGNKGEWSEFYAFLKLLADGKLYGANSDLERIEDIYYTIIKIFREEGKENLEYSRDSSISVINSNTGKTLLKVPISEFKNKSLELLKAIKESNSRSFSVQEIENFMSKLKISSIKEGSSKKTDIKIKVDDPKTGSQPELGFSIKSMLGGASTLLNASASTNFLYQIPGHKLSDSEIKSINKKNKISERISATNGKSFFPLGPEKKTFRLNLQVIDSNLHKILSYVLLYYYKDNISNLSKIVEKLQKENPCEYELDMNHEFYKIKIKHFLMEVALGMMPSKIWKGRHDATGGYIVVKEDGELLCYHIYNRDEFQDYLLKNTKLETPSTSRHDFGYLFTKNRKNHIRLNLQIRFEK